VCDDGGEQDHSGFDTQSKASAAGERVLGTVDELRADHRVLVAPRVLPGGRDELRPIVSKLSLGNRMPHTSIK
jgi:hypothetical protein